MRWALAHAATIGGLRNRRTRLLSDQADRLGRFRCARTYLPVGGVEIRWPRGQARAKAGSFRPEFVDA